MKKLNSIEKKSFLIGAVSGSFLVATLLLISLLVAISLPPFSAQEENAPKPIAELVDNCFESYNTGISMLSKYSVAVEIVTLFPDLERDNVTKGQILCSLEALDFSTLEAEDVFSKDSGRFDNANFQAKWEAVPTCEGGGTICQEDDYTWEVRQLTITLTDFRP